MPNPTQNSATATPLTRLPSPHSFYSHARYLQGSEGSSPLSPPPSSSPFSSPSSISIHPPSPTWTTRSALPPAQKTFCVAGAKLNFSRLPSPHPNQPANPPERRAPTDRQPSTRRRDRQQHVIVSGMENSLMGIRLAVQGSPFALGRKDTPFHMLLEKCLWILDAVYYCSCGSNGPPCA